MTVAISESEADYSTTGTVFVAGGTKDGEAAYFDHVNHSTNVNPKPISIKVENVHRLSQQPEANREGYQLVEFHTKLPETHFLNAHLPENEAILQEAYFDECRRLVQEVSGATEAYPYVFRVRNQERSMAEVKPANLHQGSIPIVHVDRDPVTAPERLRGTLGVEKADELLRKYKRYGSMNVWRPLKHAVEKWPLVLVDHQSIPDWDYDTHMLRVHPRNDDRISDRGTKNHDTIQTFDARNRYIYAKDMSPDQAWLFYAFHSDPHLAMPHGAFWDNASKPDALTRWSIEVRVWVFFEDDTESS